MGLGRCLTATAACPPITQTCEGLEPPAARDLYDRRTARTSSHALKKVRCRSRQHRMPPTVKKNTVRKKRGARAAHSRGRRPSKATQIWGLRRNMYVRGHGASMGLGAAQRARQENVELQPWTGTLQTATAVGPQSHEPVRACNYQPRETKRASKVSTFAASAATRSPGAARGRSRQHKCLQQYIADC